MLNALSKPTILVVDDMPGSIEILNQILADEYRVLFALNGEAGLEITRTQKPELILLDVSMPGMDGYQVCHELKSDPETRDIPIIFVTAKDQDEDQEMGFKIGAADYLTKPVRPATVKVRVKNQLQIRHSEELILHQALYDGLTHLPNRSLSVDRLRYSIAQDCRNQLKTALLFIDLDKFKEINDTLGHDAGDQLLKASALRFKQCLDKFKEINDTLGHDAGDQLLKASALRFKQCVRKIDTVGRLGGDEFVVILPGLEQVEDAKKVAENIIRVFSNPFTLSGMEVVVTVSIGIAFSPDDSDDYKKLLANADTAMYQSKEAGRNNYHLFNQKMNHNIKRRMEMEYHLRHALKLGELSVFYQPLVDIATRRIIGAEALLRWNNSVLGSVPPDEFIALAEQSGMIESIGAFVLTQGCEQFKDLIDQEGRALSLAVNVSPQQFRRGNLPELVDNILKLTGFAVERLELEVTEGLLLDNQGIVKESLQTIRQQGIGLSMDDFGTGYSSLSYLRKFPFDIIKIDQSFIREMNTNPSDQALVAAAIAMAHALGIKVIAEGVETEAQLACLVEKNCDIAQGYLFSRPLPIEEFKKMIK